MAVRTLLVLVVLCCCSRAVWADDAVPAEPTLRWWKGNLHTHSFWSDGDDFPEMIAEWYRTHGYHFLALSDHNVMSQGRRWMDVAQVEKRAGGVAMEKYRARFGGGWVETRATDDGQQQVRLKPLDEFGPLLNERGRFLLLPSEEISDSVAGKPVHLNATNLAEIIDPIGGATVPEAIANNLRAVESQAKKRGREILLHVNHPNFHFTITAEHLAAVLEERFFEVYNGHPGVRHQGDATHDSVERLWDVANSIRVGQLGAEPLLGIATDDSHDYHEAGDVRTGRGWVQVRATYLTPEHLIRAMKAGDFYASSGVVLSDVRFQAETATLSVVVEPRPGVAYTTQFIGSQRAENGEMEIGVVLHEVAGHRAHYKMTGDELYVRAVVTASADHPNPSFPQQKQQAWVQPHRYPAKP